MRVERWLYEVPLRLRSLFRRERVELRGYGRSAHYRLISRGCYARSKRSPPREVAYGERDRRADHDHRDHEEGCEGGEHEGPAADRG